MANTNTVRGEVEFTLEGEDGSASTYTLRPTFANIQAIEAGTGKGMLALAAELSQMSMPLSTMALILSAATRNGKDQPLTVRQAGDLIAEHGIEPVVKPLSDFLMRSFQGAKRETLTRDEGGN
jgi:hypothetical protein